MHAREANQIKQWRDQLLEGATGVFGAAPKSEAEPVIDVKTLHAEHLKTGAGAQDLPLPAAETAHYLAQSGLTFTHVNMRCRAAGRWTSPTFTLSADCFAIACPLPDSALKMPEKGAMDGAGLHLTRRRAGLVHAPSAVLAGLDHAGSGFLH
ncbi:MAG: hypothetical protein ACJARE_001432 [Paracoccaceae bacterium]